MSSGPISGIVAGKGGATSVKTWMTFTRCSPAYVNAANRLPEPFPAANSMLAMGRALMARPKLLLLDEPSMGLAPLVVQEIFKVIEQLRRDRGTTVLLVEQNAKAALKMADRGYVIETGKVILEGIASELLENKEVQRAYLGKDKKEIWER